MTKVEQHNLIEELAPYERKMGRYDQEEFAMFRKRDKDDEDLDSLSQKRLVQLYEKYATKGAAGR